MYVISIKGMTCQGCAASVRRVLEQLDDIERADISLEEGTARVQASSADEDAWREAIERLGYEVEAISK